MALFILLEPCGKVEDSHVKSLRAERPVFDYQQGPVCVSFSWQHDRLYRPDRLRPPLIMSALQQKKNEKQLEMNQRPQYVTLQWPIHNTSLQ